MGSSQNNKRTQPREVLVPPRVNTNYRRNSFFIQVSNSFNKLSKEHGDLFLSYTNLYIYLSL